MTHWSDPFLNIPHSQLDCGQLVEHVLRVHFGRDIRFPQRQADDLVHRSGLIVGHAADFARRADRAEDGCGVLMFARGRRAHIGLFCLIEGVSYVLHSDSLFGSSVRTPLTRLPYKVEGYYTWL